MDAHAAARRNLDRRLATLEWGEAGARPPKGWLKAIRQALGMTTSQFAVRLGVSQPRISRLERAEMEGAITLATLRQAAEALDAVLVYAIVPNRPLETMLEARASTVADREISRVSHTMALENQAPTPEVLADEHARLVTELLRGNPKRLWDEP